MPAEHKKLTKLLEYGTYKVLGCNQCGQLYRWRHEVDNSPYDYSWGDYLSKWSLEDIYTFVVKEREWGFTIMACWVK